MMKFNSLSKMQSGRSMIEMLGVLAIVGILSAAGIAGYSMAMESHKTNAVIEKIQLIVQQVRVLYPNGGYSDLNNETLINAGLISDRNNPFGGVFGMGQDSSDLYTGSFSINMNGYLSTGSCVKIVMTEWSHLRGIGIKHDGTDGWLYPNRRDKDAVIAACQGGNTRIHFRFQ